MISVTGSIENFEAGFEGEQDSRLIQVSKI